MIKRIANKFLYYINLVLGSFQNYLEKTGIIKPLTYNILNAGTQKHITHSYPHNFKIQDKQLFHDEHHYGDYLTSREEIFELHDVAVSYKGVVSKNLKTFVPAFTHPVFRNTFGWLYLISQKIFFKKNSGDTNCKYLLLYDHWSMNNYFHWIADSLSRLYIIRENIDDYTMLLPDNPPKFILDSLLFFKIKKIKFIEKDEYLFVSSLYIQNYAAGSGHQNPEILKGLRTIFSNNSAFDPRKLDSKKLIYVSRSKQKSRLISNETDVINILNKYGFEIVHFEDHIFSEQIRVMKNAEVVITSHGANVTNVLFLPQNARVLELIRNIKPNFCYWTMCDTLGLKYYYQLCSVDRKDNITVDLKELENNIRMVLN